MLSVPLLLWSILIVFLFSIFAYVFWKYGYWRRRGVPYVTPSFPFGNFKRAALLRENIGITSKSIYDDGDGHPVVGFYALFESYLMIRDPALIRSVLLTRFDHFYDRGHVIPPDSVDTLMSRSIFGVPLREWRSLRRNLTPCFGGASLRTMFPLVSSCNDHLMRYMEHIVEHEEGLMEVKYSMRRFQTDVVSETLLGVRGDSLLNERSRANGMLEELFESSWKRAFTTQALLFFFPIAKLLKLRFSPVSAVNFFYEILQRNLDAKKKDEAPSDDEKTTFGADFMETLLQLREGKNKSGAEAIENEILSLTDEDVMAQLGFFFLAGAETTSTTLTFCLFELCQNQDIQRRLAKEVDDALPANGDRLKYSSLAKMTYMEKVIQETLRKYPVIPILSRKCIRDYPIPNTDWTIEKGTMVMVSVLGLHHDPTYFPQPMRFDPNRFDESEVAKRPPGCYIPYSIGPKACIGGQFAVMTIKAVLTKILSEYEVRPSDSTPECLPLDPYVIQLSPKCDVKFKFVRRPLLSRSGC